MLNMNKYQKQLLLVAILIGLHVFSQAKPGGKTERPSNYRVVKRTLTSLVVEELVVFKGRQIDFWVGNGSGGDWKNLKITHAAN